MHDFTKPPVGRFMQSSAPGAVVAGIQFAVEISCPSDTLIETDPFGTCYRGMILHESRVTVDVRAHARFESALTIHPCRLQQQAWHSRAQRLPNYALLQRL